MTPTRLLLAVLMMALSGCGDDLTPPVRAGDHLPAVTAQALSGATVDLSTMTAGKVTILSFWASWCAPCLAEMKTLETVWRDAQDRGLLVLAVNVGQSAEAIRPSLAASEVSYPILLDSGSEISHRFSVTALPTLFLIDRQGRIHRRLLGQIDEATLRAMVKELL